MKTTLLRSAATLLTIGLCAGAMALPTAATTSVAQEDNVYLCDEGYLLTDSEFSAVLSELQDTADQTGMNIGVLDRHNRGRRRQRCGHRCVLR